MENVDSSIEKPGNSIFYFNPICFHITIIYNKDEFYEKIRCLWYFPHFCGIITPQIRSICAHGNKNTV